MFATTLLFAFALHAGDPAPDPESPTPTPSAEKVRVESEAGQALIEGLRRVLDEKLSATDRRRLGEKVLSARRVELRRGKFPGGGEVLVVLNVKMKGSDPERYISGVLTLDAEGGLASIVVPPKLRSVRYELGEVRDLDGDGKTDARFTAVERETKTDRKLTWKGDAPQVSDGAAS